MTGTAETTGTAADAGWTADAARAMADALGARFHEPGVLVAAAAVDEQGTVIATVGADADEESAASARFEIGSVTKTMTATLLTLLAERGLLALDDPIGRWLAAGPNADLTIRQLVTHTSGLPGTAASVVRRRRTTADPWAGYGFAQAEADLSTVVVRREGPPPHRYSNLGFQLLALLAERAAGRPFGELMRLDLFGPLGMNDSTVGEAPGPQPGLGNQRTLLRGHSDDGEVESWTHPLGAGGVDSTIADLARYVRACLNPPDAELGRALRAVQEPMVRVAEDTQQAPAWAVRADGIREHTGGTAGFSAYAAFHPGRARGVALLVNHGGSPVHGTFLAHAGRQALADGDPRQVASAQPQPWPDWRETADAALDTLLAGDAAELHASLAAKRRAQTALPQFAAALAKRVREAGGAAESVEFTRQEMTAVGAVLVHYTLQFPAGRHEARILVLPSGELGGVALLPVAE
jgi:CubicO group peptidase (beta-lactamase class C family)